MSKPGQAKYFNVPTAAVVTTSGKDNGLDGKNFSDSEAVGVPSMNIESSAFVKGTVQEPAYRDRWFGVAFLAHFGVMISVAVMYATGTLETVDIPPTRRLMRFLQHSTRMTSSSYSTSNSNSSAYYSYDDAVSSETSFVEEQQQEDLEDESDIDGVRLLSCFLLSLCSAPLLALVAMKYMTSHGVQLIQGSLYFAIGLNVALGAVLFIVANIMAALWNFIFAVILVWYAKVVWHRIPYAAANLKTAVTCVHANLGMVFLGLAGIPFLVVWCGVWGFVFGSVLNSPWLKSQEYTVQVVDDDGFGHTNTHEGEELTTEGFLAVAALLLSFYWTWHVMRNVVHTTLAGTVGTWWFVPHEANGCCSRGLRDSLSRSLTYSFGSICFGSLLVAIIEVVKYMVRSVAHNRRSGLLRLIAQCLLGWIERLAEYFNKWAFIYVGLYGYSYVEAGKNVVTLFRNRGWSTIISDALIHRMLAMMCFCIGLINALAAAIWAFGSSTDVVAWSAGLAFVMGLLLSSMTFGVVISAVDSVIVLFAESPAEFKDNHPALCRELEDTWTQAWPDIFTPGEAASSRTPTAFARPVV